MASLKRDLVNRADVILQRATRGVGLHRSWYDVREVARARLERRDLDANRKLGLLFVHVPKCGGSSIEAQWGFSHAHRSAVYFRAADPAFFARAWKFSIVRNPYDRLVSAFHYLKSGASPKAGRVWAADVLADVPDFAAFTRRLGERDFRERVMAWLHFQPQWYFLCDKSGKLIVDEVGRLEAYGDFIDRFNAAGHGLTLNASVRERASKHLAWPSHYDAESAGRVAALYARDFEIFGYPTSFGQPPEDRAAAG
ncbi:MAG: sulfotransferase family 2 domain-containing protein [Amaricoccus sp.]